MLVLLHELVMAESRQHPVDRRPGQPHVAGHLVDPDHLVVLEQAEQPQDVVDGTDQPLRVAGPVLAGGVLHVSSLGHRTPADPSSG